MTAEIVNLRQYRKKKLRQERTHAAEENRVCHGRNKAKRRTDKAEHERSTQDLDGKQLDPETDKPAG